MMNRSKKQEIDAPCGTPYWNDKHGKTEKSFPNVACGYNCNDCGWNPAERERRMTEGEFRMIEKTHDFHDDDGNIVSSITKECKTLIFPKGEFVC